MSNDLSWKTVAEFRVYGDPKPGGSKRAFVNRKTGRAVIVDACKKNKQWRDSVATAAVEAYQGEPLTGPIKLAIIFYRARPKSHYGTGRNAGVCKATAPEFPTTRPDATKLLRSTEDALTGILWRDDSQIVQQRVWKQYSPRPGALIALQVLEIGKDG